MCTETKQVLVCLCVLFWTRQCQPHLDCSSTRGLVFEMTPTKAGGKVGPSGFVWPASHVFFFFCLKQVQLEAAGGWWFCSLKFSSISSKQYVCHQVHPSQQTGAVAVLNLTCFQSRSWQQMMKCSMFGGKKQNNWKTRGKKKMNRRKSLSGEKVPVLCLVLNLAFFFLKNAFNKKKKLSHWKEKVGIHNYQNLQTRQDI